MDNIVDDVPPYADTTSVSERRTICKGRVPLFYAIVPVCLIEYVSLMLTRAVIPGMQIEAFGTSSYAVEGATYAVQGVLSFFFCPLFGAMSDRYGRKLPLALSAAGALLPTLVLLLGYGMVAYQIASALSGVFKGSLAVVFAYVADTLPPGAERTAAFGVVMGTLGVALSIGPFVGGVITQVYGEHAVFLVTLLFGSVAVVYTLFVVPETRTAEQQEASSATALAASNPLLTLRSVWSDPYLKQVMTVALLYYISYWGLVSSVMLYLTRTLGYSVVERGRFLSMVGMYHMLGEFILVRLCIKAGMSDRGLLQTGLAGWIVKLLLLSRATSRAMLDLVAMMSMIASLFNPSLVSLASSAAEVRGKQVCARNFWPSGSGHMQPVHDRHTRTHTHTHARRARFKVRLLPSVPLPRASAPF